MIRGLWRPRVDVPEFKRCCFCLPLRHGLLVWGYLKIVGLSLFAYIIIEEIIRIITQTSFDIPAIIIIFVCFVLMDLIFHILFIVAGHMKHQLLFKTYYYYSLVFLVTFVIGYFVVLGILFYTLKNIRTSSYMILWLTLDSLYIAGPILLIQIYVTLLVRSEARKLDNNSNFQFVNATIEAGGTLGLNNFGNAAEP